MTIKLVPKTSTKSWREMLYPNAEDFEQATFEEIEEVIEERVSEIESLVRDLRNGGLSTDLVWAETQGEGSRRSLLGDMVANLNLARLHLSDYTGN